MKTRTLVWSIALTLYAAWGVAVLWGKGGFMHLLLLCAIGATFIQWMADRRAAQAADAAGPGAQSFDD